MGIKIKLQLRLILLITVACSRWRLTLLLIAERKGYFVNVRFGTVYQVCKSKVGWLSHRQRLLRTWVVFNHGFKLTTYFAFQCNTIMFPLSFLAIIGKPGSCFVPCQVLGFPSFHCRTGEFSWCYLSRVRLHCSFKVTLIGIHLFRTDTFQAGFYIAPWFHLIVWSFDWFLGQSFNPWKNW